MGGGLHLVGPLRLALAGSVADQVRPLPFVVLLDNRAHGPFMAQTPLEGSSQPCRTEAASMQKALPMGSIRRDGRRPSPRRIRPVTPEVAGSSPSLLSKYLQIGIFCCPLGRDRSPASRIPRASRTKSAVPSEPERLSPATTLVTSRAHPAPAESRAHFEYVAQRKGNVASARADYLCVTSLRASVG